MSRESDRTESLRRELVAALVEQTGMREVLAMPYADCLLAYLQREYGGDRLYIPAQLRQYDMLQIRAALELGKTIQFVCREHGMSRSTLYKLFPGGLPQRSNTAA